MPYVDAYIVTPTYDICKYQSVTALYCYVVLT